jgi:hypothetical protein
MQVKKRFLLSGHFLNISINLFITLYIYQTGLFGYNYGDASDGTVQMYLHEHWWRWLNQKTTFFNTEFFYPFDRAFGYSDVFLAQGPMHILFRILGFSINQSWTLTTLVFLLLGNLGWSFLSFKIFHSNLVRIFFVLIICSTSSFVGYFASEPNIVGYTWISYLILLIASLKTNFSQKKAVQLNRNFGLLLSTLPIYALSCWYGTFFSIFMSVIVFFVLFINDPKLVFKNFVSFIKFLKLKLLFPYLIVFIAFSSLFLIIYLPAQSDPYRPILEMLSKSPRLLYLLNGSFGHEGGILKEVYKLLRFDNKNDMHLGIGLITVCISLFFIFFVFFSKYRNKKLVQFCLIFFVSPTLIYFYFLGLNESFSIHSVLFQIIPGFNSIRVPVRFVIFMSFFYILGLCLIIDYLKKEGITKSSISFILLFLIFIDHFRMPIQGWNNSILTNLNLESQVEQIINECDYFYYDAPGGWWYDQMIAMALVMKIDVPTTNGNSGGYPPNYPVMSFTHEGDISGMVSWISQINQNQVGCITNGELPIYRLNSSQKRFDLESGFTSIEKKNNDYWRWSISQKSYAFLFSPNGQDLKIEFQAKTPNCNENDTMSVNTFSRNGIFNLNIIQKSATFQVEIPMNGNKFKKIEFSIQGKPCSVEGDQRELYFEIKNWKII